MRKYYHVDPEIQEHMEAFDRRFDVMLEASRRSVDEAFEQAQDQITQETLQHNIQSAIDDAAFQQSRQRSH
ncbi:MAG TPA: hypothetical protein VHL10_00735 [Nitrososphaera sp.]|jgi:predicted ATPase with chaperone activity|nr:hypothetical protein [Nitrososphaera sp.]